MKKNNILFHLAIMGLLTITPEKLYAFSKLRSGFETITESNLIPLARIIAGGSVILWVTMSFFKQDEHQRKISNVFGLGILLGCGVELMNYIINIFN